MKKLILAAAMIIAAMMPAAADLPFRLHRYDAFKATPTGNSSIVFMGNSITNMHEWREAFGNDPRIVNRGNSGGPLINQYGQVIGINTIKMMSRYDTIEGLGFAIPSSLALRWVNELIEFGELQPQPVLGVTINRIPQTLPDGAVGLRLEAITDGLSGDRAGLRAGDYLVAFAGQDVVSYQQLLNIRRDLRVGDEVAVRVYREGEYLEMTMIMMAES